MLNWEKVKLNLVQIYSIIVKDLKLKLRFKNQFLVEYVYPLLSLFFPFIIFNTLFNIEGGVFESYYSRDNYVLFILLAYCVQCLIFLLWNYKTVFHEEKIWQTLKGLLVAPINKINILLGLLISGLIAKSLPIIVIMIICYIFFPIPFTFFIGVILVMFCISLTFAGMGFIIGLFEIVNEDIAAFLTSGISFISLVSCLFYPIEIFPEFVQFFVRLNPLYYYFDLLRLTWWIGIDYTGAIGFITMNHILFVSIFTIVTPLFASYFFLLIYNKYGSSGY